MFFIPDFIGPMRDAQNAWLRQDQLKQDIEAKRFQLNDAERKDAIGAALQAGALAQANYDSANTSDYVQRLYGGMGTRNDAAVGVLDANARKNLADATYNANSSQTKADLYTPEVMRAIGATGVAADIAKGRNNLYRENNLVPATLINDVAYQQGPRSYALANQETEQATLVPAEQQARYDAMQTMGHATALGDIAAFAGQPAFTHLLQNAVTVLDPNAQVVFENGQHMVKTPGGMIPLIDFANIYNQRAQNRMALAQQFGWTAGKGGARSGGAAAAKEAKPKKLNAQEQAAADKAKIDSVLGLGTVAPVPTPGSLAAAAPATPVVPVGAVPTPRPVAAVPAVLPNGQMVMLPGGVPSGMSVAPQGSW